jgi:hypothetical protein
MPLADDIMLATNRLFPESDRAAALALLSDTRVGAVGAASSRLQRCAFVASRGSLAKLRHYLDLLETDFRDLIVAGEYESISGELVQVRDLSQPLSSDFRWSGP